MPGVIYTNQPYYGYRHRYVLNKNSDFTTTNINSNYKNNHEKSDYKLPGYKLMQFSREEIVFFFCFFFYPPAYG